jgi:leucyl-tRNA synthetase
LLRDETFELVVQVNGKHRGTITIPVGATEEEATKEVRNNEKISTHLSGKTPKKVIFIQDRLINFVI